MNSNMKKILENYERVDVGTDADHPYIVYVPREPAQTLLQPLETKKPRQLSRRGFLATAASVVLGVFGTGQ